MKSPSKIEIAEKIMWEFAEISGLKPRLEHPRRYLWTDAFAVCNYLELYRQTGDKNFLNLAVELVDQVHHILGRFREDDYRKGWISGLNHAEGENHPTRGGLRIGKELNERQPGEPLIEQLEWDRDGQYYHYLTKWMHALCRLGEVKEDFDYVRWALDLAQSAHNGFTYTAPGRTRRMYWKMSVDLTHPQVTTMGQQDPLDGYITYLELQQAGREFENSSGAPDLSSQIRDISNICRGLSWFTDDPLGIGGLLSDALRLTQLKVSYGLSKSVEMLLFDMLESAVYGLERYNRRQAHKLSAQYRLAFREMGLSIGINGLKYLHTLLESNRTRFKDYEKLNQLLADLQKFTPLADSLENYWLESENRKSNTWTEHREINMVMLATSLAPCGFLKI